MNTQVKVAIILLGTLSVVYMSDGRVPSQLYKLTETEDDRSAINVDDPAPSNSSFEEQIFQTVLQNPAVMSLIKQYLVSSLGQESPFPVVMQTIVSSMDKGSPAVSMLTSMMEEMKPVLQYMMSAESLENDDLCVADMAAFVQGLRKTEMWTLQMLDASGKPGKSILQGSNKFLGNYDECLEISHVNLNRKTNPKHVIKGNYCSFVFTLPPSLLNVTSGKLPAVLQQLTLQWDLCLPKSCNNTQVADAVSRLLAPLNSTEISLQSVHFTSLRNWKEDGLAVATVVVFCVVVLLSVIGTLYDVITTELKTYRERKIGENGGIVNIRFVFEQGHPENGVVITNGAAGDSLEPGKIVQTANIVKKKHEGLGRQLLLSFSLHKNTEKILGTRTGESNLGCIHGIRVISMAWVILGHSMSWDSMRSVENVVEYASWMRRFTFQFIINGTLSVDTFFLLSGCLVTYLFLKESAKTRTGRPTVRQMVLYYVHRWWRLTPMYMFILLLYTGLLDYLIQGPQADGKNLLHKDHCRDYWWRNILYINNFSGIMNMCMPVTWFLSLDMQFYVIAPAALLPLAFGISWLGYTVISLLITTHIIAKGYLEWQTDGSTQFVNGFENMDKIYFIPWCRVGVFAIGMFLGALLQKTKCKAKISKFKLLIGWQFFLAIGLLCTYVTYDDFRHVVNVWDVNTRIIHETLYRPGWGLFVSWIIFVCCTGHGGFINSILSWSAWIPLGKLTYGAYLIHPLLLNYTEFSVRTLRYVDVIFVAYRFIGTFAVAYALAFVTSVLVEAPCMGLEKAVLNKLKK